jgi:hypothetical protein
MYNIDNIDNTYSIGLLVQIISQILLTVFSLQYIVSSVMNRLSTAKRVKILPALVEGASMWGGLADHVRTLEERLEILHH